MSGVNNVRFASWNVKGLKHLCKRKKIMSMCKSKQHDIVFLQETHLSLSESEKLLRDWVGQVYCSAGPGQRRGVIMLINKKLQVKCIKVSKDTEGRIFNFGRNSGSTHGVS